MEGGSQGLTGKLQTFPGSDNSKGVKLQVVLQSSPLSAAPSMQPPSARLWAALAEPSGSWPLWEPSTLRGGVVAGVANAQKEALSL